MASHQQQLQQQPLLMNPSKKSSFPILKLSLFLSLAAILILCFSALFASNYDHNHNNLCRHALHQPSCLSHLSEIIQSSSSSSSSSQLDQNLNLLKSILIKSTSHIHQTIHKANSIKPRLNNNNPYHQASLLDCLHLMDLSLHRTWDSIISLTTLNTTTTSQRDTHTWLSSVLTNHATCLDQLHGSARAVMEPQLQDLISRARTSLAILVATLPPLRHDGIIEDFPAWVAMEDRRLMVEAVKADAVVAKDGSGRFKTVAEAVASAPDNGKRRYVIYVKKGIYKENVEIGKKKTNVMVVGDGMDATIITGSLNVVDGSTTFRSATLAVVGDGFIAQDIQIKNTAGPQKHQAVALRVGSDKSVINRCKIDAFQDSLYAHTNRQFYRDSFITGTVDFIFGNAAVVFQKCKLVARKPMPNQNNMVTAQGRIDPNQNTATSIQQCDITPSPDLKPVMGSIKTYLGRPWKEYSRTVVIQSYLDSHIDPSGWAPWDQSGFALKTLYFGEYQNRGPGAGTSKRVKWPGYHVITTAAEAYKFTVAQLIQGGSWLKTTGVAFTEGL